MVTHTRGSMLVCAAILMLPGLVHTQAVVCTKQCKEVNIVYASSATAGSALQNEFLNCNGSCDGSHWCKDAQNTECEIKPELPRVRIRSVNFTVICTNAGIAADKQEVKFVSIITDYSTPDMGKGICKPTTTQPPDGPPGGGL